MDLGEGSPLPGLSRHEVVRLAVDERRGRGSPLALPQRRYRTQQHSNIENGLWSPLVLTVRKLSLALGVDPQRFVNDSPIRLETLSLPDVG